MPGSSRPSARIATLAACGLLLGALLVTAVSAQERLQWRFALDSTFVGRFVGLASDGTIYVSDNLQLYALTPAGVLKWKLPGLGDGRPVAVDESDRIYVANGGGVTALEPDGTEIWTFDPEEPEELVAGPSLGPDGNIYTVQNTATGGIGVYALNRDGELLWSDPGDPAVFAFSEGNAAVHFGPDQLFFGSPTQGGGAPGVWVFSLDGEQLWTTFETSCSAMPEADRDGRVLIVRGGSCNARVHDFDSSILWNTDPPGGDLYSPARPAVGPEGNIYTTGFVGDVWSLTPTGVTRWYTEDVAFGLGSLGVSPDGSLLVGGRKGGDNAIVGIDTADGALLWEVPLPDEGGLPQVAEIAHATFSADGGTVYLTTRFASDPGYGYVYAVATGDLITGATDLGFGLQPVLRAPHPNPTHGAPTFALELPVAMEGSLGVYDVRGRRVVSLRGPGTLGAGRHEFRWSGRDDGGRSVASGVYLLRFDTPTGGVATARIVKLD